MYACNFNSGERTVSNCANGSVIVRLSICLKFFLKLNYSFNCVWHLLAISAYIFALRISE